jgi:hypothetical protein
MWKVQSFQIQEPTLANVTEPHVPQGAGTLAVNSLELTRANNDVGQGSTVLKNENGILASSVLVGVAGATTVILSVAQVHVAGDRAGLGERDDRSDSGRDVQSLRCGETCQSRGGKDVLEQHVETAGGDLF